MGGTVIPLSLFLLILLLSSSSFFVIHKRETANTVILLRVAPNDETAQILSDPPQSTRCSRIDCSLCCQLSHLPQMQNPLQFFSLLPSCHLSPVIALFTTVVEGCPLSRVSDYSTVNTIQSLSYSPTGVQSL